jgi:predicted component of viral defense system (DUF524 family)
MKIKLFHVKANLVLEILGEENTLFEVSDEETMNYGEAKIQLVEGCIYEYEFSDPAIKFKENSKNNKIVSFSKFGKHKGLLTPNIYVGTHSLEIENVQIRLPIEVRSIKSEYRSDYRYMLESITEKCTDLIMQIDSPINQHFETNFDTDSQTLYQRFSFVKSLIDSREFEEAIQRIISNPATTWQEEEEEKDVRRIRRFNQKSIKQLISSKNRIANPASQLIWRAYGLQSLPNRIKNSSKVESVDTGENRFIKHALEEFLFFCENCESKFENYSRARFESFILSSKISSVLNQSFFKEISRPTSLKINSPVLQRKLGYREVLKAWFKFDLAARLIWRGGDNVYEAGKKDIATLYEYWLFFTLLDLFKDIFDIEPKSVHQLIQYDKGKLSLNLKQGKSVALKGIYTARSRNLNIQFSYNRSFGGGKSYPNPGSYTTTLRPDYTLSIWPGQIVSAREAELKELITHIHFDAKYKVNNFYELVSKASRDELTEDENNDLTKEEIEEDIKGNYKNQDLLKMHTYKDAIRRSGGAYVLYPGEGNHDSFRGFHELIPGLGAFVIRPNDSRKGQEQLRNFIVKVIDNFMDRASQREYTAAKVYDIHKNRKDDSDILNEPMPEYVGEKQLIPDEIYVLVGFYKSNAHLDWILKTNLYNFRTGTDQGSLTLGQKEVSAEFLVLHGPNETRTNRIFKIKSVGPKLFSKQNLIDKLYPTIPTGELYLVYDIEKDVSNEFSQARFDLTKVNKYSGFSNSAKPISITMTELMKAIEKKDSSSI